jgi:phosphinothricin acetyltransferase
MERIGEETTVRPAREGDDAAVCAIYNEGVADRLATLDTHERTVEEMRRWRGSRGPRHPVLVAERGGEVVGWGSLNEFNPREAYRHVADFSVYVRRTDRRQGVGARLTRACIDRARELGYHKLVLAALDENGAGRALYARLGFREVGIYREQGRLDGRWVDVVVMERLLEVQPRVPSGA